MRILRVRSNGFLRIGYTFSHEFDESNTRKSGVDFIVQYE